jgi:hypothetical protein
MAARQLLAASLVSLCCLAVGALFAAPMALAEESCPNGASRQGPSVSLPDCRAYEQVTPINKGDAEDLFPSERPGEENHPSSLGYVGEDGNSFLLETPAALTDGGQAYRSVYVFSRGAEGWSTTPIAPGTGTNLLEAEVFNPDLSEVGIKDQQVKHVPGQPEEQAIANLIGPPAGPYATVSSASASYRHNTTIVGASTDLNRVVLEGTDHELAPPAEALDEGSSALYEWSGGQFHLTDVNTDGSLVSPCGAILGQGSLVDERSSPGGSHNAVSSDGSRIVFTAPDPDAEGAGCWNRRVSPQENPPELYMRLNGATTVEISKPEPGVSDPTLYPAVYVGASADDSKVFFMTETEVTKDDTGHAAELYEYNTEAPEGERLVRVSSGESGVEEGAVDFVPAISSDGSTVYFAAYGQLTSGLPALGPEEVYLYRYDTATRRTTYITRIESYGYPQAEAENPSVWSSAAFTEHGTQEHPKEMGVDAEANWYTTADGGYLVFAAPKELTGYDNEAPPGDSRCSYFNGQYHRLTYNHCLEIYRYSASNNSLVCVSCGAPGVPPTEGALFARSWFPAPSGLSPRPVSEDGSDVFFDTSTALVAGTTDEKIHVYEWHNGSLSLISSADDPGNAYFLGASADGSNVFFGTHAQLVPQDADFLSDVYDARVDGGFVPVTPSLCTGTGCQGVPAAPPVFATPASVTFEGVGNFPAEPPVSAKPTAKSKTVTGAQKLARALKACRRDLGKRKRKACEASARKRYGSAHRSDKSTRGGK